MDMNSIIGKVFSPLFSSFNHILFGILEILVFGLLLFLFMFWFRLKRMGIKFSRLDLDVLANKKISFPPYNFLRWMLYDLLTHKDKLGKFKDYGFTIFVGRQGSGKTISMVNYLNVMRHKYPSCLIITNFKYKHAHKIMKDWRDFLTIRNGEKGVIFAIDEIHSEYSAEAWKTFPESILSEISQQRKQKVKIVATAQVFSRVAKPIREQAFSVVSCKTVLGRLTFNKEYDAAEYSTADTPYQVKKKCRPIKKTRFIQTNLLRESYDTYEKIQRMSKLEFIPRNERH